MLIKNNNNSQQNNNNNKYIFNITGPILTKFEIITITIETTTTTTKTTNQQHQHFNTYNNKKSQLIMTGFRQSFKARFLGQQQQQN